MKRRMCTLALALALAAFAQAAAVQEGVVEAAQEVALGAVALREESYVPQKQGEAAPEPAWAREEVYTAPEFDGIVFHPICQDNGLTSGEAIRAQRLLASYRAGEAQGDGERVLGAQENVTVGVYPLNPEDYDGETVYLLLPGTCLTDEELLAIIDAYDRLGKVFDPDDLNGRNCMRGGSAEATRSLTGEERTRLATLKDLIRRGMLPADAAEEAADIGLDARYASGLKHFSFLPYRAMSDAELAGLLLAMGVHNEGDGTAADAVEAESRAVLTRLLACPLSMTCTDVYTGGAYVPRLFDVLGREGLAQESRSGYGASFVCDKGQGITLNALTMFDAQTGDLVCASAMDDPGERLDGETLTWEKCLTAAQRYARETLGRDDLGWYAIEPATSNWGTLDRVRARLSEGLYLTVCVARSDGEVHGVSLDAGTEVGHLPED